MKNRMGVSKGWEERRTGSYVMGIKFQFFKRKNLAVVGTTCYQTLHLEMVNCIFILPQLKNISTHCWTSLGDKITPGWESPVFVFVFVLLMFVYFDAKPNTGLDRTNHEIAIWAKIKRHSTESPKRPKNHRFKCFAFLASLFLEDSRNRFLPRPHG